jgi:two-component system response regulator DegU
VIGPEPIRIVIFEPQTVYRRGLVEYLAGVADLRCVGTASTESEIHAALAQTKPNVVVFASPMSRVDVVAFVRAVVAEHPDVKLLAIGNPDLDLFPTRLICAGVSGYVLKNCEASELLRALRVIARGRSYFSLAVATAIVERIHRTADRPRADGNPSFVPTGRELEVLELLAVGKSNQAIAAALQVSERTVENHLRNVYRKLGVHDRAQAMLIALRRGYVSQIVTEPALDGNGRLVRRD